MTSLRKHARNTTSSTTLTLFVRRRLVAMWHPGVRIAPMGIRTDLHRHLDEALVGDARTALIAVRRLLEVELPWLERHVVGRARRDGYSWARIARLLGRSRQAVQQRFRDHDESWRPPAPEAGDLARRTNRAARREIDAALLRSRYREDLDRWDASGDDVIPW